jgi:PAS domain S-box-containing protein
MSYSRYYKIQFQLGVLLAGFGLVTPIQTEPAAAFCFIICSIALILDFERCRPVVQVLGVVVVTVVVLAFAYEMIFETVAVAFGSAGLIFVFKNRISRTAAIMALQYLWFLLMFIAFAGFVGTVLNEILGLPIFEQSWGSNPMIPVGLIVLSLALFYSLRRNSSLRAFYGGRQDRQIAIQGIVLLVCAGLISGLTGAGIMAKAAMREERGTIVDALHANSRNLADALKKSAAEAGKISSFVGFDKSGADLQEKLARMVNLNSVDGVKTIRILGQDGRVVASAGEVLSNGLNKIRLAVPQPSWLYWQNGLRLESTAPIYKEGRKVGEVRVDSDLSELDSEFNLAQSFGLTGEVVVCAQDSAATGMNCLPSHLNRAVAHYSAGSNGHLLPMSHALSGKTGTIIDADYRGKTVLAAYQPIGDLGLGMVQKIDIDELYARTRNQLQSAFIFFLVLASVGSWILFQRIRPLVRGLIHAEAKGKAILNNLLEAVLVTDGKGVIRSSNISAQRIFGYKCNEGKEISPIFRELPESFIENFPKLVGCNGLSEIEGNATKQDGSLFPCELAIGSFNFEKERHFVYVVRDLTERRRAIDALRESEEKLRSLFELSPLGIVLTDLSGGYVDFNAAFQKICGYSAEELRALDYWTLNSKQYEAEDLLQLQSLKSIGRYGPYEKEYLRKDGSLVPVRLNGMRISGRDGREYIWSIVEDISEFKLAEKARQERERYIRYLLESLRTAVVVHDSDGKINYLNSAACRFFGSNLAELAGRQFLDGIHLVCEDGSTMPEEESPMNKVFSTGKPLYNYVVGMERHHETSTRWVLLNAFPDLDENGFIKEVFASFVDFTDMKKSQEALVESSEKLERLNQLHLILTRVSEATIRVRSQAELFRDVGRILVESGGFLLIWIGLLDEEKGDIVPLVHVGKEEGYLDFLNHTGLMAHNGPSSLMIKTDTPQICMDIATDPRMSIWREEALKRGYRSSAGFPILLHGRKIGVINAYAGVVDFFSEDIATLLGEIAEAISFAIEHLDQQTKQEAAEAMLKKVNADLERRVEMRTRQLEVANAELEAFSYSVSHDLRAPLRSINGFSDLLLKHYSGQLDETAMDYLKRVKRSSKRMGELIEDLLKLSRVTRSEINNKEVDLSRIVLDLIEERYSADPLEKWEVQLGICVTADERLMKIVMENLIGNAWKFSSTRQNAKIIFGMFEENNEKIIYVQDNGAGFDMKYANKLFGAFQRLHKFDEFEGTGIGLATVHRIISKHGGRIWAEGEVGIGATFYFSL